jgi:hypothetical protein
MGFIACRLYHPPDLSPIWRRGGTYLRLNKLSHPGMNPGDLKNQSNARMMKEIRIVISAKLETKKDNLSVKARFHQRDLRLVVDSQGLRFPQSYDFHIEFLHRTVREKSQFAFGGHHPGLLVTPLRNCVPMPAQTGLRWKTEPCR